MKTAQKLLQEASKWLGNKTAKQWTLSVFPNALCSHSKILHKYAISYLDAYIDSPEETNPQRIYLGFGSTQPEAWENSTKHILLKRILGINS